ncbi:hypothetical protein SCREM1_219 [Synechococcus phage S-CREM1]|nr:hypothetical protein SCREM1_219 [Synechococcus phage S-CREM1]
MFTNNFKLDGIENILDDIGYMEEMKDAGEDQEHKYTKKSGKKSKDYDGDGTVEDETDEYAGVKDRAIKKAMKKENIDFSSVLDELTDEDLLFLTDELIEESVEEIFNEMLDEGFEVEELETLLIESLDTELTYLEEAKVTVGHDTNEKPESSRSGKLARIKSAVQKVASGAKKVAKKVAGAAGEVAGAAVSGYKKASAAASDAPGGRERDDSTKDTPRTGTASATKTSKKPGILGRVKSALKSGLKKAIHSTAKAAGKVAKTAKAGYDEGRGKTAPASKPASAAPKPASKKPAAKPAAKKKSGGNLDNLLSQIRNEEVENIQEKAPPGSKYERMVKNIKAGYKKGGVSDKEKSIAYATAWKAYNKEHFDYVTEEGKMQGGGKDPCWKGYEMVGMKKKGGREVPNCVPKEEYEELVMDMIEEGYDMDQVREVIAAYEDGFEVIFEEDQVVINDTTDILYEEAQFLSDVEMVADWLYAEEIIDNEDEFFELMEDLTEEEIEELYDLVMEAEGSYGETPKAYAAASKTKMTAKRKPFLKAMQRRTNPANRKDAYSSPRKGMTASDREEARAGAAHGSPRGHDYPSQGPGGVTKNPKKLRKQKAMGEFAKEDFELWVESLVEEGYDLSEYTWDDMLAIYEAEGSYGKTPKAREAMGKLAIARREKPASEYSQKGEKTKKVKAIEKHTRRIDNGPDHGHSGKRSTKPRWASRGKLDQDARDYGRADSAEYGSGTHGSGTVTKNPKKLRKQKAIGEIGEGYMIGDSLDNGGLEVRNYSWRDVMGSNFNF